jgi:hypothetical protein
MMTSISSINSAALLILQQTSATGAAEEEKAAAGDLVAVANGADMKISSTTQPGQAESRISEQMFSVNNVNINKLKMELIDRAAEALGFDESDYDTRGQFASAMRVAVVKLAHYEGGEEQIAAIEKELGLDKLGVSLLDVVSSARNPELDDKVSAALEEREGVEKDEEEEGDGSTPSSFRPDEIGLYGDPSL